MPDRMTTENIRLLVHAEHRALAADAVAVLTQFYAGSDVLIDGKRRVAGGTVTATDTDWSHGSRPLVEGPALALMLATTGRTAALADLAGPGLETLRSR